MLPVDYKTFPEKSLTFCRPDALFISMHITPKSCGNLYKLPRIRQNTEKKPGPPKPLKPINKSASLELLQCRLGFTASKLESNTNIYK
jgi:hypothetical protein